MEDVIIFDTTLRDGEQSPGCSMSIEDKVKIAKMLNEAKVDVIEAGFAASNERDFKAIKEISKVCDKNSLINVIIKERSEKKLIGEVNEKNK